jgi:hypothetical protein
VVNILRDFHSVLNKVEANLNLVDPVRERLTSMSGMELQVANMFLPVVTGMKQLYQDARTVASTLGAAASKKISRTLRTEKKTLRDIYPQDSMNWLLPLNRSREQIANWLEGKVNQTRHKSIKGTITKLKEVGTKAMAMNVAPIALQDKLKDVFWIAHDALKYLACAAAIHNIVLKREKHEKYSVNTLSQDTRVCIGRIHSMSMWIPGSINLLSHAAYAGEDSENQCCPQDSCFALVLQF